MTGVVEVEEDEAVVAEAVAEAEEEIVAAAVSVDAEGAVTAAVVASEDVAAVEDADEADLVEVAVDTKRKSRMRTC